MLPAAVRLGLLLLGSGFCALVYQTVWLRLLRLVFGASTASTAAVLAIFMGGLGLGGAWLGRKAERSRNPLRFYAHLEIAIAILAAASPFLIQVSRSIYLGLGGSAALGDTVGTLLRLALSTLVLGVTTTLMGGTLPAVARAAEEAADLGRRSTAWLYALNTFGGVVGVMLTTFVLIEVLGSHQTLWLACALNLLVAMVARSMARAADAPPTETEQTPADAGAASDPASSATAIADTRGTSQPMWLVLPAAAIVGFVFLVMELVWYRMLAPILGGSSYTFGLILAVALAGIGVGGLLYALGDHRRRPGLLALGLTCALEALFLIVPFALGDQLALVAIVLQPLRGAGFTALVGAWTVLTALVVALPAIVAGYQFPLLVGLLGSGREGVGRDVGLTYAWNTWGAIVGSIAGGFLLLPGLGATTLWRTTTLLLLLLAVATAVTGWPRERSAPRLATIVVLVLATLVLCAAEGPSAFWRHQAIGAGRTRATFEDPNALRAAIMEARFRTFWEREGLESSVALSAADDSNFLLNGKADGSARTDAPTQVMSGLVGAALHPEPRSALVIGLGTGSTAGWLAEIEGMDKVDVVELEPAMAEVAQFFAPVNHDVLAQPNVSLTFGDGRELVLTTDQRYDVIFSEPSNPYRAGIASLFSQDFYRAIDRALASDGLFLQWLQTYDVDADVIGTAYTTLRSVFPHVDSWGTHTSDLLLVASRDARTLDLDRLRAQVDREPYRTALRRTWGVEGLEGLFTGFLANDRLAAALASIDPDFVSTDDRPRIEFGFARNVGARGSISPRDVIDLAHRLGAERPSARGTPIDWPLVEEMREIRAIVGSFNAGPAGDPDADWQARRRARDAYRNGRAGEAARLWRTQSRAPVADFDRLLLAQGLAETDDPGAEEAIAALGPTMLEAEVMHALRFARRGEGTAATNALMRAFDAFDHDPWPALPVMKRALLLAEHIAKRDPRAGEQLFATIAEPFAARLLERQRLITRMELAQIIDFERLCVDALQPFERQILWNEVLLTRRAACYQLHGHPLADDARADLEQFLAQAPPKLGATLETGGATNGASVRNP